MTEQNIVPIAPTAEACFVEAAANLRVAERMASLGHSPRVKQVVHIADAWTRLGTALDNARGFDPAHAIPIRLVGDEDPQWMHQRPAPLSGVEQIPIGGEHKWPILAKDGPLVCRKCGFGPNEVGPECMDVPPRLDVVSTSLHVHKWNPFSTVCQGPGCGITRDQAEILGEYNQPPTPPSVDHKWNEDSGFCENDRCRAHHMDRNVDLFACPVEGAPSPPSPLMTPDHEHTGSCRHRWETSNSPCVHGCGAMPAGFYVGGSGPTEVCPEACSGFTT